MVQRLPLLPLLLVLASQVQPLPAAEPAKDLAATIAALPTAEPAAALRRAALALALERADLTAAAGLDAEAATLRQDLATALAQPRPLRTVTPDFLPAVRTTTGNPHWEALDAWAKDLLAKPDIPWVKATASTPVFKGTGHDYGTRDEAIKTTTLFWLVAHPQSHLRNDPELFTRMLRRALAYADDYELRATKYQDDLNDFFALGPATFAWNAILRTWPDALLPSQRSALERTVGKVRDFWLKVYQDGLDKQPFGMGHYCNRDLGVANILVNAGQILNDQACLEASRTLVAAQRAILYPDGAFAYIGTGNESCGYHDADVTLLTRYWLITGDPTARDLIAGSQWYGPLSNDPRGVAEFWTAPAWKHTWNGSGSLGGEVTVALTGNATLRWMLDQSMARTKALSKTPVSGGSADPLAVMFYRNDVKAQPVPDNYTVIDRNIEGPRAHYGRFSYAITTRIPGAGEPGKTTLAGAMLLDKDGIKDYPLHAGVLSIAPKVRCQAPGSRKTDWAWLTRDDDRALVMARHGAGVSVAYALHQWGSSQKGADVPWKARQEWITIRDRMIGLIEISPDGPQQAAEITCTALLGTGGTKGGPAQQAVAVDDHTYRYGDLVVGIPASTFARHEIVPTRIRTSTAAELTFRDGREDPSAPVERPYQCILDIHPATVTDAITVRQPTAGPGVGALEVVTAHGTWTLWHNRSEASAEVPVANGATVLIPDAAPAHGTGRLTLPAHGRALVINGGEASDLAAAWPSFAEMVAAQR